VLDNGFAREVCNRVTVDWGGGGKDLFTEVTHGESVVRVSRYQRQNGGEISHHFASFRFKSFRGLS